MIVADTNLIAYLFIGGERGSAARTVFERDPQWVAPILWRSEFRNVLAKYIRGGAIPLAGAEAIMAKAEELFAGAEFEVASGAVLAQAAASGCTAYDCEFAVLAEELAVPVVTSDARMLAAFRTFAVPIERFARRGD